MTPHETAFAAARTHGALVRWPGGFWTHPECGSAFPATHPHVTRPPRWYVRPEVIKDLLYRGKLVITEMSPKGFPTKVVPR